MRTASPPILSYERRHLLLVTVLAMLGGTTGCSSSSPEDTPEPAPASSTETQAQHGAREFGEYCAKCHGASGEGGKGPRLVGLAEGALPLDPPATAKVRTAQFRTAADVAGFVVKYMPADAPASLPEADYWAILAFDLEANGVDLEGKTLDAELASTIVIHP